MKHSTTAAYVQPSTGGKLRAWTLAGALIGAVLSTCALSGCAPVAVAALGAGSSAGVQQMLGGISDRTFTAPLPTVKAGALKALAKMDIKVKRTSKTKEGANIEATATNREVKIQLEALSPNTTRMRAMARNGLLMDGATAAEIIVQTEKALGQG